MLTNRRLREVNALNKRLIAYYKPKRENPDFVFLIFCALIYYYRNESFCEISFYSFPL